MKTAKQASLWEKITNSQLAIAIVIFGVVVRLLPLMLTGHLGNNFAPITAIALFGGVYLNKKYAIWLPLIIMAITDLFLGLHPLIIFTWGSFALIGMLGLWLRTHKNVANTLMSAVTGSVLFFFITNMAVWAFTPMYLHNAVGLSQCFVMAIPFFRNTLASDLFYTTALFGAMEVALYLKRAPKSLLARG